LAPEGKLVEHALEVVHGLVDDQLDCFLDGRLVEVGHRLQVVLELGAAVVSVQKR
jgi:hypothetical protein